MNEAWWWCICISSTRYIKVILCHCVIFSVPFSLELRRVRIHDAVAKAWWQESRRQRAHWEWQRCGETASLPPVAHLLYQDLVSYSFPNIFTDWRPSAQTQEPVGAFLIQATTVTHRGCGWLGLMRSLFQQRQQKSYHLKTYIFFF